MIKSIEELFPEIENNKSHSYQSTTNPSEIDNYIKENRYLLPEDLLSFYRRYSWVRLYNNKYGDSIYKFGPIKMLHPTRIDILGKDTDENGPIEWITICDVMDGNYICIDLSSKNVNEWNYIDCFHETFAQPGECKIIAKTFTELVEQALHGGGDLFYLKEDFKGYGDGRPLTAENAAIRCEHPDPSKKGWIARFTINEKHKVFDKFFRDDDYGSKEGSFEAIKIFILDSLK
jgi:hypothetical protein